MNQQPVISKDSAVSLTKLRDAPKIARSALFGILFVTAILLLVVGTLYALSGDAEQTSRAYPILLFNLAFIILLGIYLGVRVWRGLFAKRRRQSAPLLHRRFVTIFSLAALTPAIVVGAFSTSLISQNINDLFGDNVRSNMASAREILDGYVQQEFTELATDARAVQNELNRRPNKINTRISYTAELQIMSRVRELDAVYVMRKDGYIFSRVENPIAPIFEIPFTAVFEGMNPGEIAFIQRDDIDYLIALTRLQAYEEDIYLYVGRVLRSNNRVLSSLSGIANATQAIDNFNADQALMSRIFFLTFIETALLILFAAVWLGLLLANRIIEPLGRLITASERVRSGDMSARVDVKGDWGEMSDLGSAFNRMTRQLNSQRDELVKEHDISEQRRQFSEAVLSGVRAGVIGLTQSGRITLMNESAEILLGSGDGAMLGYPLEDVLPEFMPAFNIAREAIKGTAEDQVNFDTETGIRNFDLRVSAYKGARKDTGWVMTFDDMTRLVTAQRHSAWREVARRIAHEIKNPLTPIQLSAERLLRKYSKEIKTDPDVFQNCTQTIIRQVGSLEQMVNEFSAFARMPTPNFEPSDIKVLVQDVLFAQGVSFPEIEFDFDDETTGPLIASCDERLITQALTNLYKNSGESIVRRIDASGDDELVGYVKTTITTADEFIKLRISDNGMGWPFPDKERLLEPYVTTRESGTGLGLAIVMRIAEDHGGTLRLFDHEDKSSGAVIEFMLPKGSVNALNTITETTAKKTG
ncbi:sensor histidine kinase [Hellea balneolensis]|uniref:sensor histidine kinase n=1 Tax=Hellea balneolensis TaxID=287478 RepID=UPI0006891661|nr:PAS domain-containing sensor histidine kinase [Hellea balneolensis]